jgi:hypothetical protein
MNREQEHRPDMAEQKMGQQSPEDPKSKFQKMVEGGRQQANSEKMSPEEQKTSLENSREDDQKYLDQQREKVRELFQLMKSNEQAVADLQDPNKKFDRSGLAVDPAGKKLEQFQKALAQNKEDWLSATRDLDQDETAFIRGNKIVRRE